MYIPTHLFFSGDTLRENPLESLILPGEATATDRKRFAERGFDIAHAARFANRGEDFANDKQKDKDLSQAENSF